MPRDIYTAWLPRCYTQWLAVAADRASSYTALYVSLDGTQDFSSDTTY